MRYKSRVTARGNLWTPLQTPRTKRAFSIRHASRSDEASVKQKKRKRKMSRVALFIMNDSVIEHRDDRLIVNKRCENKQSWWMTTALENQRRILLYFYTGHNISRKPLKDDRIRDINQLQCSNSGLKRSKSSSTSHVIDDNIFEHLSINNMRFSMYPTWNTVAYFSKLEFFNIYFRKVHNARILPQFTIVNTKEYHSIFLMWGWWKRYSSPVY